MNKLLLLLRKSITRRYIAMMLISQLVIVIGAGVVLWRSYDALTNYQSTIKQLEYKDSVVADVAAHTNQMFFRTRGYYAFQNENEYKQIFEEYEKLKQSLALIKELPLSGAEQELIQSIETFIEDFKGNVLPKAIQYVEAGNYDELRKLSSSGVNAEVNRLITYADQYKVENQALSAQENNRFLQEIFKEGTWFIVFVAVTLFISLWITKRTAKDIGTPLRNLSDESELFAQGQVVQMKYNDRQDEIGQLSRTLHRMMVQIMGKEEMLLAQNEELIAQQDELQIQQEELQEAIVKMENNEQYLKKRNHFILSLANSLDKQEMLNSIIQNLTEVLVMDKGIIIILQEQQYASFGISEQSAKHMLEQLQDSIFVRVLETKQPYILQRESYDHENGYEEHSFTAYDLYLPVMNVSDDIIACIVLTKIGRAITNSEQLEAIGLVKQISLALDKLNMYEETEYQRQLTQNILDTIQEGIQMISLDGTILQVNQQLYELWGLSTEQMIQGSRLTCFMETMKQMVEEPDKLLQALQSMIHQRDSELHSWVYRMKEPNNRIIRVYGEPLYQHEDRVGTILVHRDITQEYEIDKMKSEFVSTVSHELRTPLASVLGFTELLLHKEMKPERQRKYLTTIHQEAKRLTALINDFLDLQRMESGRQVYDIKPVDLAEIMEEAIEISDVPESTYPIHFEKEPSVTYVLGDHDKLLQVCLNLLSNAVKYSPHGGDIHIRCYSDQQHVYMEIQDQGLGIPEDAIPNLFDRFYRVDNSDRRAIGGTGLGLSIVKEILLIHEGHISAHSTYGAGSMFRVELPIYSQQKEMTLEDTVTLDTDRSRGSVLLLEDDQSWAELLQVALSDAGYKVHVYADDRTAWMNMELIHPSVMVIDLVLDQKAGGWRLLERLKEDPRFNHVPIIVCSAFEEKHRAAQYGIDVYLVKPFKPSLLIQVIEDIQNRRD